MNPGRIIGYVSCQPLKIKMCGRGIYEATTTGVGGGVLCAAPSKPALAPPRSPSFPVLGPPESVTVSIIIVENNDEFRRNCLCASVLTSP